MNTQTGKIGFILNLKFDFVDLKYEFIEKERNVMLMRVPKRIQGHDTGYFTFSPLHFGVVWV